MGNRDEQELICQGEPFARNVSLIIFLYTVIVLLLFATIKRLKLFKCLKHPEDLDEIRAVSAEIVKVKDILSSPESCLGAFQVMTDRY